MNLINNINNINYSNESILNSIIESTADGILVVSNDGHILKTNKKFKILWNISDVILETNDDEKIIASILDQLYEPELFLEKVKELYSQLEKESFDILNFIDGKIFERYSAPYKMDEKILGRVWSFRDITKQKQTEETLNNERIILRTIIDNLPDAIYAKDINFRKTLANKADLNNMGCKTEAEALGKTDFDFFSEDSANVAYNDDKSIVETGNPVIDREEDLIDKNGRRNWILTTKIPLKDKNGNISGIIGVGRNITNRKKNELIRETLYEISESVLTTFDMTMLYKKIHHAVSNLMPAKNFFIAIHNLETNLIKFPYYFDEHDPSPIERPFGDGLTERILKSKKSQIIKGEKKIKQLGIIKEEEFFPKQWVGIYLNFESKYKGVLALQDYNSEKVYNKEHLKLLQFVSEHIVKVLDKRYANELIQKSVLELSEAKKELELINKNKNRFFSIIAHDLRSPFMTLLGISQMVSEEFENLSSEEIKDLTNTFYNSTQNIYKLIENLLTWSRLQLNTFKINPNKLDLKTVVHNVKQVVEFVAKNKNISIQDYIPQTFVWADKNCVETVLRNLIGNAIKYSNRGGEIKLSVIENKDFVEISIIDNGIGMNKPTLNSLFNIGNVVSKKGTENEQGSALGLILCKDLLTKNNGKIWAESKLGKGSKFIFTLPILE